VKIPHRPPLSVGEYGYPRRRPARAWGPTPEIVGAIPGRSLGRSDIQPTRRCRNGRRLAGCPSEVRCSSAVRLTCARRWERAHGGFWDRRLAHHNRKRRSAFIDKNDDRHRVSRATLCWLRFWRKGFTFDRRRASRKA